MSDLIRREDAYAAIRGLTRHIDRIAAITALPAVQPDRRTAVVSDAISRFDAQKLVYDYCHARTVEGRQLKSPAVFTTHTGTDLAEAISTLPAVQPAHVNETPKSEHVPGDVLTPATKGGA